jgi:uncharacterized YigZ family protein
LKDHFLTIKDPAEGYYMERGSKFLAYAYPLRQEAEVQDIMTGIRKEHPKARHYCTAMRLHPDASLERFNDDGEPSGTAGRPILGQLIKQNLTNVFVVVVRYFGGTKLGVPGLIEAYKTSAANALEAATVIEGNVFTKVSIGLSYESFPHFLNFCKHHAIPVFGEAFTDSAVLTIGLRKSTAHEVLTQALKDYSKMDFTELRDYIAHLGFTVAFLNEDEIL